MKNELRIGNLVNFKTKPRAVYQIRNSGCDFHIVGNDFHSYVWDAIKPVPLTEEWFLKFGFEKSSDGEHWFVGHLGFCLTFDGDDWCLKARIDEPYVILYIRTVHKIQNVYFALTGKELELN